MAKRRTGVTVNASKHMIVDAAAIYRNYGLTDEALIGATDGGVTFNIEQEVREPEIDGVKGPIVNTRRILRSVARATFSPLEWTTENFKLFVVGAEESSGVDGDVITRSAYQLSHSLSNIGIVGTKQGTDDPVVIVLKNPLADGDSLEFSMEDGDEASPEVQVTAHYDPADTDEEPWEIRNPQVVV